ncbi:hypothetical protein K8Q93_00990 [Candidatus Parcubacteria bacterium]|nr:hypothetical protein [Candidatus Parcubacteria bacterium]
MSFLKYIENLVRRRGFLLGACLVAVLLLVPTKMAHAGLLTWIGDKTAGAIIYGVTWLFMQLGIVLMSASAYLLDLSIRVSLGIGDISFITRGSLFTNEGVIAGWTVLRDISNIGFIFALVYIAVRTILGIADSGALQKQVVAVIIGAMLINFSAFITLVVIDAGNGLATVAYNQITRTGSSAAGPSPQDSGLISDAFLQYLRPQTLIASNVTSATSNIDDGIVFLLTGTLFLFAAYVLLEASFIFIVRTVRLMFSIVVAPLMFVAYAIPGLQGNLKKWFEELLGYSMVAPAYMFAILFILLLIKNLTGNATIASGVNGLGSIGNGGDFSVIKTVFLYILILILMNRCLAFARSASKEISEVATSWAGTTLGLAVGGVAGLGRMTVGRAASKLATSEGLKNYAARSVIGSGALRATKYTAGSSFDVRKTATLQKGAKAIGADLGKAGGEGGYDKILKTQVEAREKFAKDYLGTNKKAIVDKEKEIKDKISDTGADITSKQGEIDIQVTKTTEAAEKKRRAEGALLAVSLERDGMVEGGATVTPEKEAEFKAREAAAKQEVERYTQESQEAEAAEKVLRDQLAALEATKTNLEENIEQEKKKAGNSRQEAYAKRISSTDEKGNRVVTANPLTWIAGRKNKEAAEKIRKSFKEDKQKRLKDALKEAFPDETGKDKGKEEKKAEEKKGGEKKAANDDHKEEPHAEAAH